MNIFIGIIVGFFVLMSLVTLHELGHFLAARKNGVKVLEFGICFPPRAIAWTKGADGKWHKLPKSEWDKPQKGLILSLNWLPIGGFCQMDGESANDKRKNTFGASSFWSKTKILFAGVLANWITAFVILTILAWTGMPKLLPNQFTIKSDETLTAPSYVTIIDISEDSPAAQAGFKKDDIIIKAGDEDALTTSIVTDYNNRLAGQKATYTVKRGDENLILEANLNQADSDESLLGIQMSHTQSLYRSTWSAPLVGLGLTAQMTGETIKSIGTTIWDLISGALKQLSFDDSVRTQGKEELSVVSDSVSGPIGIVGVLFPAFTSAGATNVAYLAALIAISLACMNILPIPALDGGRWLLIAIYKLRKKELSKETEEKIVSRAFMVLLIIAAIITILDIRRFF